MGSRFVSRDGCLELFDHPMIEAKALRGSSGRLVVAVFERPHPGTAVMSTRLSMRQCRDDLDQDAVSSLREFISQWPLHWFWLELGHGRVSVESSPLPTAPVFIAENNQAALIDWDPLRLYPFIDPILDEEAAAQYISNFDQPYGPRTVIRQIKRLAAGYLAQWRPENGWKLVPPLAAEPSYPRVLETAADPVESFRNLMDGALARLLPNKAIAVAAGLSGGLDSTAMVTTASRRGHSTHTFGLIMPGSEGKAQQDRRNSTVTLFGLKDYAVAAEPSKAVPGDYGRASVDRMVPWEELHYDLFDDLYAKASTLGHSVFLSGFGGDELLLAYWDEVPNRESAMAVLRGDGDAPDFLTGRVREGQARRMEELMDTPPAYVQSSVMDAIAGTAAQYMRCGLWPVHLFATPDIVRYCHGLPQEWRENRRLIREMLQRAGLPAHVSHSSTSESFTEISRTALIHCRPDRGLLRTPRLADLGLVEPASVAIAYRSWLDRTAPPEWDIHFIAMTVLEATLRSIENARSGQESFEVGKDLARVM